MQLPVTSPRHVHIDDAASFARTTPEVIRHYHRIGLLPEPGSGTGQQRPYGYEDVLRLLWIGRMAGAGVSTDHIRDVFADQAPSGTESSSALVQRLRTPEGRLGLLSDLVGNRLKSLPPGSLRQADLDILLVTEQIFGPLGAAVQAGRFILLATHPDLQEESNRVDAAEAALDDAVAVDDPRVAQAAADRHAIEQALDSAFEDSGLAQGEDQLFEAWDALHPDEASNDAAQDSGAVPGSMSVAEAVAKMPYDFSPARQRCMELVLELAARE